MSDTKKMEKIVSLCKRRGFIFQGSEIYGGLAGTWDYGPMGVALKKNIQSLWWRMFVNERDDMYGLDAAILMNEKVWEASGHTGAGFSDPVVVCQDCNTRFRADHLIKDYEKFEKIKADIHKQFLNYFSSVNLGELYKLDRKALSKYFRNSFEKEHDGYETAQKNYLNAFFLDLFEQSRERLEESIKLPDTFIYPAMFHYLRECTRCPTKGCREKTLTGPKNFNLMFETKVGAEGAQTSYLRPETAQGIFTNYKNVLDSLHPKLPFGIAQIGKAFRNEIAPRDFIFRAREFEQMEIEWFVRGEDWEGAFTAWQQALHAWTQRIGLKEEKVYELEVPTNELAHYSKRTIDFEYEYPFGRSELYGLAYRTDHDLKKHQEHSGVDLTYFDQASGERFLPHVIEPSLGVDRTVLAVLDSAYTEEEVDGETRVVLKFKPDIAPVKIAVLPLMKKPELKEKTTEVFDMLKKALVVQYDETGSIGKRYRRQDEIGTPYCVTIDYDSLEDGAVTVRDRDTMQQERIKISDLEDYIQKKLQ